MKHRSFSLLRAPWALAVLWACAGFFPPGLPQVQGAEMAILPLRPAELLKTLPSAESGWRMTVSMAQDIPDAWPRTKAFREFVFEEGNVTAGVPSAVIAKLQVTVIDTGGHPGTLARFASSRPGDDKTGEDRFKIGSMPALRKGAPGEKQRVEALDQDRFLLIVVLEFLSPDLKATGLTPAVTGKPEDWIGKINLAAVGDVSARKQEVDVTKDRSMVVEVIDELNPKRSSRSTWSFAVEIPKEE